ncbi:putative phage tail protein [Kushneria sinocarnis]|uniref:Putative phage tail protein n=1 Tax=Kushneria sinocarnis TaxID=595502 RepID=A0A420WUN7_9GAMM|nr:phage tail protein [Kushneria sinocarnis]RKQ97161.1 putative phage tail protein [Kushneria sinocarnis]
MVEIVGQKGGKGGGGGGRVAQEDPNTLQANTVARIIDLMCEGPIEGLVNGEQSIFIDETPLMADDGTYNFDGIEWEFREGTPDQDIVNGFSSVENQTDVSTELTKGSPLVRSVTNLDADAVRVTVGVQRLTQQDADDGDLHGSTVEMAVDVRADGGDWSQRKTITIDGKTTSQYPESHRIELPGNGPWDIRLRRLTDDHDDDSTIQDATYWFYYTTIIDGKFIYPDSAYIALKVDAKQFGSSIPNRAYQIRGLIVSVPDNYDPETREYSGIWSGQFKKAWTNNPAWIFYDIATNNRYGAGLQNVDKWSLYQIAQYCDELVPNGYGADEPRFTMNTVINSRREAYEVLNTLASAFRGMLYWSGDAIQPVQDAPQDASRHFGPSDIADGEFKYTQSRLRTRHSVALVTWNDPEDNYRQAVEVVEDADAIQKYGWVQTDITAFGCTSRGQARRLGLWTLYSERNERDTIEFDVGLNVYGLEPGQIIDINDPSYQGARLHGRLTGESTTTELMLDRAPDADLGDNRAVTVMLPNGSRERKGISSIVGNRVTLDSSLSAVPVANAVWMISSDSVGPRKFRIVSIAEKDTGKRFTVTALEHDPNKYARVEQNLQVPDSPTTLLPTGPIVAPLNITVETYTYLAGGNSHQALIVSWTPADDPRVQSYVAQTMGPNDVVWQDLGTTTRTSVDVRDVSSGEWQFRVASISSTGRRSPWSVRVTTIASMLMPAPPDSVDVQRGTFSLTLLPTSRTRTQQLYQFYRSLTALDDEQIEGNATFLGTSTTLVDSGLNSGTVYQYYVRGYNAYGVSDWYPVQAETKADFSDIINALEGDIESKDRLYQSIVEGVSPGVLEQVDADLDGYRQQLESNGQAISELQQGNDEQALKMLLLKAAGESSASTLRVEQVVRANLAQQVTTLQTGQAQVEDDLYTIYDPETDGFTAAAIRTVDVDGRKAVLGMRSDGEIAEIGAVADRFYIYNEVSGEHVLAFVVEDGRVVMPESLIGQLNVGKIVTDTGETLIEDGYIKTKFLRTDEIQAAKLISTVDGYNGRPSFALREDGSYEFNSTSSDGGGMRWNGETMTVQDSSGTTRIKLGRL